MPSKKFSLADGEPQRLEISWKGVWKNISIKLDSQEIGTIANMKELKKGKDFDLGDDSKLSIQLINKFMGAQLQVLVNGENIPGSGTHPADQLKTATGIIYFLGGLNLVIGLIAELGQVDFLLRLGFGAPLVVVGFFLAILGYFTSKRSRVALSLAILFVVADTVLSVMMAAESGNSPSTGGLVMKIFFIVGMAQGFGAISQLNRKDRDEDPLRHRS
ncbi:hypothetical protein [Candidatus Uabimicrobium sp. HlEnr_7]|uniref:hypothetical protein n=1 Tax=Candidatus Uabimicrobium helgolandensis TaxID=3095367 RepID=UPI0035580D04